MGTGVRRLMMMLHDGGEVLVLHKCAAAARRHTS